MSPATSNAYQQVSISTADPGSLVVQLFDGAGRFIARSRKALAAGDQATFAYSLSRAHAIVADRSIVSTELAPENFRSLWFQRKRWAQGWLEVTLRYQRDFWRSKRLGLRQKLYWTYLLLYRELYPEKG